MAGLQSFLDEHAGFMEPYTDIDNSQVELPAEGHKVTVATEELSQLQHRDVRPGGSQSHTIDRLESQTPRELAHLVTTWADGEDSGHCWLALTPAQAMRLRQIQTTPGHDSSVPIKHGSPTPAVQKVWVQTPAPLVE